MVEGNSKVEEEIAGMLEYETQIFLDIAHQDGLIIAAKGLSLNNVLVNILKVFCDPGNLIIVLNSSESEERYFLSQLESTNVYSTTFNTNTVEREDVYLSGGIHFVTTRILVVDFLKKRLPIDKITGIFVLNAHKVLESCQEAFVLRLYRQTNKTGFIKAFSNDAQSFTYGFGQVERIMRTLFIKELYIWPRFHSTVIQSLKKHEPQVIELHIPISPKMDKIQTCLLELMNKTVKELKLINKTLEMQEITVENCLIKKFHKILQSQLDPIWNQLSTNSKTLITDLKTLRHLLSSLFYSDSVTFYSILNSFRSAEYAQKANWIFHDEAEHLFVTTKSMVFSKNDELNPEVNPKWKILFEILNVEIPADVKNTENLDINVLILCQDRKTCFQINQFLRNGAEHYLFLTALRNDVKFKSIAESFKRCEHLKEITTAAKSTNKSNVSDPKKARLSVTNKKDENKANTNIDNEEDEDEEEEMKNSYMLTMSETIADNADESMNSSVHNNSQFVFEAIPELDNLNLTKLSETNKSASKPTILIRTFKQAGDVTTLPETLQQLQPNFIIMYHSNVTAIREIELYEARRKHDVKLKVFFIIHAGTVEEQSYLTSLRREKQAFEHLIQTKSTMVVPEDQDGRSDDCLTLITDKDVTETPVNTRRGGRLQTNGDTGPQTVIVDMREFRSELPALIHKRGLTIEPLTITVGDYILTPDICVERKSISDLVGSLNSGRLYQQCTQMSRYYSKPMLLIEFDQNKPFNFESNYMVSNDGNSFAIQQKLLLLTMHFPKLKLIWSPSPYATAVLFDELKEGKEQPNSEYALAAKSDLDIEVSQSVYTSGIYDFMRKLPGITSKNIAGIMNKYKNLAELCKATEEELNALIENSKEARSLYSTLHEEIVEETSQSTKPKAARNKFKYTRK